MKESTIAIIGAGAVGTTTAFALAMQQIGAQILLIDIDENRCRGETLDLQDALSTMQLPYLKHAKTDEIKNADIIIIAAGKRQKPGQTRDELLHDNKNIIEKILAETKPLKSDAIIIMVTNPVEILASLAQKITGLPHNQVIGSGTFLDSLRMRALLAQKLLIAPEAIHAYIIGEHGDSQIAAWSISYIAGIPLTQFGLTTHDLESIATEVKNRAYQIIECKGATFYGIARAIAEICRVILNDQHLVKPLSCYIPEFQTYVSIPVVIDRKGIKQILPITLNSEENELLQQTVEKLRMNCSKILKNFA